MDLSLIPHTRIHPFLQADGMDIYPWCKVWLKREDECGHFSAGGKLRKYASLLPWLQENQIRHVGLIGAPYANHILAFGALLLQDGMNFTVFHSHHELPANDGNGLLGELLFSEDHLKYLPDVQKNHPEATPQASIEAYLRSKNAVGDAIAVIPEGAFHPAALPGAMTLAADICRNELDDGLRFCEIFVDAGTGLSAAALILAIGGGRTVHVVSMADPEEIFREKLSTVKSWAAESGLAVNEMPEIRVHRPLTGKSFGSAPAAVMTAIHRYASQHGVLCDPIYSAKLLMTAEALIADKSVSGKVLIVHSGGLSSVHGFGEKLRKVISRGG